jgi:hypothetical protein
MAEGWVDDRGLNRWRRTDGRALNLYLHLSSRTWDPTAETWDLKEMP